MRFLVMVRATKTSEAGDMPGEALITAMGNYNEELVRAGVKRAPDPFDHGESEIEIRRVFEPEDFGAEIAARH